MSEHKCLNFFFKFGFNHVGSPVLTPGYPAVLLQKEKPEAVIQAVSACVDEYRVSRKI